MTYKTHTTVRNNISRWDPRYSYYRDVENSLDMECYRRRFPGVRRLGLSARMSHIRASLHRKSLGYASWGAFAAFLRIGLLLFTFFAVTTVSRHNSPGIGIPLTLPVYRLTAEHVGYLEKGYPLVDGHGNTYLDPRFDRILTLDLPAPPAAFDRFGDDIDRLCDRARRTPIPRKLAVFIDPAEESTYADVVTALDAVALSLNDAPECPAQVHLVTDQGVSILRVDADI